MMWNWGTNHPPPHPQIIVSPHHVPMRMCTRPRAHSASAIWGVNATHHGTAHWCCKNRAGKKPKSSKAQLIHKSLFWTLFVLTVEVHHLKWVVLFVVCFYTFFFYSFAFIQRFKFIKNQSCLSALPNRFCFQFLYPQSNIDIRLNSLHRIYNYITCSQNTIPLQIVCRKGGHQIFTGMFLTNPLLCFLIFALKWDPLLARNPSACDYLNLDSGVTRATPTTSTTLQKFNKRQLRTNPLWLNERSSEILS